MGRRCATLLVTAVLSAQGCAGGPPPPPTPETTVIAFARALSDQKLEPAYAMMSDAYRARVPFATFKALIVSNTDEVVALANDLSHLNGPGQAQMVMEYGAGSHVVLSQHGDRWLIEDNLIDFYDQSTPRAALKAFVEALERQRYDVLVRLVPQADKEGLTTESMQAAWSGDARDEAARMLSNLRAHMDAPIEIAGARATMPYGDGMRVQFIREGQAWKIEDPE